MAGSTSSKTAGSDIECLIGIGKSAVDTCVAPFRENNSPLGVSQFCMRPKIGNAAPTWFCLNRMGIELELNVIGKNCSKDTSRSSRTGGWRPDDLGEVKDAM